MLKHVWIKVYDPAIFFGEAFFTKLSIQSHKTLGIQPTYQSSDMAVSIESVDMSSSDPEDALDANFYY